MKIAYILPALVAIFLIVAPVAGTLNKISGNVPVFIGESDVDISSSLNGCHTIDWWPSGRNINSDPPGKNISIVPLNSVSDQIYHYTFSPDVFTGFTGTWYCEDRSPHFPVFSVNEPEISVKIWDLDNNMDVTGQSIPFGTNITYRIDTNLDDAINYISRPNANPTDSFYSVAMTDPRNRPMTNLYTGSAGNTNTVILPFDARPFIMASPYYGKNMKDWSHSARDPQGIRLYPEGTYLISVRTNLNHMAETYATSKVTDTIGKISSTATVTLLPEVFVAPVMTEQPSGSAEITISPPATTLPSGPLTTSPIPKKTTYSPLPVWITLVAAGACGIAILIRRH